MVNQTFGPDSPQWAGWIHADQWQRYHGALKQAGHVRWNCAHLHEGTKQAVACAETRLAKEAGDAG